MNTIFLKINNFNPETRVEGPFIRSALWVQGCSMRCQDCCNKHMQDFNEGKQVNINELSQIIKNTYNSNNMIEGITILGGEPLDQAGGIMNLLVLLKKNIPDYGIILFTGYNWTELCKDEVKTSIINLCDMVVAGPYDKTSKSKTRRWIGSDNQTIHFITPRYKELLNNWPKGLIELEIVISDNEVSINGTPTERKIIP